MQINFWSFFTQIHSVRMGRAVRVRGAGVVAPRLGSSGVRLWIWEWGGSTPFGIGGWLGAVKGPKAASSRRTPKQSPKSEGTPDLLRMALTRSTSLAIVPPLSVLKLEQIAFTHVRAARERVAARTRREGAAPRSGGPPPARAPHAP